MIWLRQSTAVVVSFGPAVLFSDGVTLVTNLVGTGANQTENTSTGIRIAKNGGAFAARHATATASTYDAFGNYLVTLDTTDTGTLGVLRMQYANASAFCPLFMDFMIVPAAVWDTYFASSGGVAFPTSGTLANTTNITGASGVALAAAQKVDVDTIKTQAVTCAAGVTVLASVGTAATSTAQTGDNFARLGAPAGASVSADIVAINAKTTNLPAAPASTTNITAGTIATVSGNVNGNVGGSVASVTGLTASNLDASISSVKSKTDLIPGTQDGKTFAQTLLLMAVTLLGKASGLGTATAVFRALDDSKDRVTTTVDASGNRTATTLDAS